MKNLLTPKYMIAGMAALTLVTGTLMPERSVEANAEDVKAETIDTSMEASILTSSVRPADAIDTTALRANLIEYGKSIGMIHDDTMNRSNSGWAVPRDTEFGIGMAWATPAQMEAMIIDDIQFQMHDYQNSGWEYFNIEVDVRANGHFSVTLIR